MQTLLTVHVLGRKVTLRAVLDARNKIKAIELVKVVVAKGK
jgi:hypothetical protein